MNMLVPGDPDKFTISTALGTWEFERFADPNADLRQGIEEGHAKDSYMIFLDIPVHGSRAAVQDQAVDELLYICLSASYLCGQAVTLGRALPMSDLSFLSAGGFFPRMRGFASTLEVTSNLVEYVNIMEAFVQSFPQLDTTEKARLLVHHWLDGLSCWSLEDLTLSTSTMLEVIAATAKDHARANGVTLTKNDFPHRIEYAADRFGIIRLGSDFRNMRNDLVHEGTLSSSKFPGKDSLECAKAVSECLDWIDTYMHTAFSLGPVVRRRFKPNYWAGLNSFSLG
ncbi:hypothetical protein [Methylobacterium sp. WL116]|uniref:hypothetical protein n=1 Tax=Methylobacterium sp. WL116 TaxID=2603889 RepID=UPI0011CB9264|nr:hypothetical protein [Methylobacterium sp. WL116]TXM95315.1 hypothetical protein FV223_01290 [Methylobacterium sp. WL116]